MLNRINELLEEDNDFAIETTLATRTYVNFIKKAKEKGFRVTLLFFWLKSHEMAINRVATRVLNGGHHIPSDIVERRYLAGIKNLVSLYIPIVDVWRVYDNSENLTTPIAHKLIDNDSIQIFNTKIWTTITKNT